MMLRFELSQLRVAQVYISGPAISVTDKNLRIDVADIRLKYDNFINPQHENHSNI